MTIVPDTKDWTWVLRRSCPECGFDTQSFPRDQIPSQLLANAEEWRGVLAASREVARRPRPEVWSPLEYACHVRDVFRLYYERLALMLAQDHPTFPDWDQDATAAYRQPQRRCGLHGRVFRPILHPRPGPSPL